VADRDAKSGRYPRRKVAHTHTRKLAVGGREKWQGGTRKVAFAMIYNSLSQRNDLQERSICKKMIYNVRAVKRHRRGGDYFHFNWEHVIADARKFRTVFRCRKDSDRQFVYRVLAASQHSLPPWAVWDALEAVKVIRPHVPMAYFRTVLQDNCQKAGIDLDKAIRGLRVPADIVKYRNGQLDGARRAAIQRIVDHLAVERIDT
jgi:hypothetical protein